MPREIGWVRSERERLKSLSDSDLVAACLNGSRELGWAEMVGRYEHQLRNHVYRLIGDSEEARDVVQQAFTKLFRNLWKYDPEKKFSSWLYVITDNVAKNLLRTRGRNPLVFFSSLPDGVAEKIADHSILIDELMETAEQENADREEATKAMHSASDAQREALRLHLIGKSYEEIAGLTGVCVGTVKSRIFRARECCAQSMGVKKRARRTSKRAKERRDSKHRSQLAASAGWGEFRGVKTPSRISRQG